MVDQDSPEVYLARLEEAVSKAEIAHVLAIRYSLHALSLVMLANFFLSADPFYAAALKLYISKFDFSNDPLDVALRRLLMDVGLPKETQQIDRVMEAFADRYTQCNSGLFISPGRDFFLRLEDQD